MSEPRVITAGIDVGTGAVKAALVADGPGGHQQLAVHSERIHRRDPAVVAEVAFQRVLARAGIAREVVAYVASTGEGEAVPFCDGHFYGMTTHARGASFLVPGARSVVDMGALHTRVFAVDESSRVLRHRMTSQCASGTGQFLENIARYLGVRLDEVGPLSLAAARAENCSSICAVLAETDVINMVSRGIPTGEILRGVHESIAQRIVKLLGGIAAESPLVLTGGLARDSGLRGAIERRLADEGLALEVHTHPDSACAGAIGAALWASVRHERMSQAKNRPSGDPLTEATWSSPKF